MMAILTGVRWNLSELHCSSLAFASVKSVNKVCILTAWLMANVSFIGPQNSTKCYILHEMKAMVQNDYSSNSMKVSQVKERHSE
jgi:hypothetical protein